MEQLPARLTDRPSWLVGQVAVHAHRLASDGFAGAGARGYHYRILAALDEFGAASQADLGRRCAMDRSDVVAAINELAGQDLVARTPDPADRRRNTVTLTAAGGRHLRSLDKVLDGVQDDLLGPLTKTERQTLTGLLARLLEHHRG